MSTGDANDMLARLRAVMPPWFPDDSPIYQGALAGAASGLAFGYALVQFARAQTRIATATGGWLDLIAWDFFGSRFGRRSSESDDSFRPRIKAEVLRPRQTRAAIVQAVRDLTGKDPLLFEPWNPGDCGAYGFAMGYNCAGCYGSRRLNNQIFVTVVRPPGQGVPNVGGYGEGPLAYGEAGEYIGKAMLVGPVSDAEIYKTVAGVVAAGVRAWTAIVNAIPSPPPDSSASITADASLPTCDAGSTVDHC